LKTFTLTAAPFIPFLTETMWQNLKVEGDKESVHLMDYPVYDARFRDEKLEFQMETVQKAVSMGRSLRNQFNIKNRQPLSAVALVTRDADEKKVLQEMEDTIAEELNVKKVIFHDREDELVEYSAKANFRVLGKQLGPKMKLAAAEIAKLSNEQIAAILDGQALAITVDGQDVDLTAENVIVERIEKEDMKVVNDGTLTVGLETKIPDDLRHEGYARDLVRGIQNMRKESGFEITDRINLEVSGDAELKDAFVQFRDFIAGETLAATAEWKDSVSGGFTAEADDKTWTAKISKVEG
jgi:isoleucyl-tRNA synthetase